jgi:hypothetical protein
VDCAITFGVRTKLRGLHGEPPHDARARTEPPPDAGAFGHPDVRRATYWVGEFIAAARRPDQTNAFQWAGLSDIGREDGFTGGRHQSKTATSDSSFALVALVCVGASVIANPGHVCKGQRRRKMAPRLHKSSRVAARLHDTPNQ